MKQKILLKGIFHPHLLSKLKKDLEDVKTITGQPARIYSAYREYTLIKGILQLETIIKTATPEIGPQAEYILADYRFEVAKHGYPDTNNYTS
jgi:hypothetical protein